MKKHPTKVFPSFVKASLSLYTHFIVFCRLMLFISSSVNIEENLILKIAYLVGARGAVNPDVLRVALCTYQGHLFEFFGGKASRLQNSIRVFPTTNGDRANSSVNLR